MPASPKPKVRLHYLPPSHYNEKARKILQYKGIAHEVVEVPYGDHSALLKATGQDYTPYIELPGARRGVPWNEVADWAEKTQPRPTLYPGPAPAMMRAGCRVFEHWAHNVVEEAVWRYVVTDVPRVLKDDGARWRFVEFQERKRGPMESLLIQKPLFLAGMKDVLVLAEEHAGFGDFLTGNEPSLADFALYGALHPLKFTGQGIPRDFPKLREWHARVHKL